MIGPENRLHLPFANTQINVEKQLGLALQPRRVLVLEPQWPWIVWSDKSSGNLELQIGPLPWEHVLGVAEFFLNKLHGRTIVRNISFPVWIKTFTRVRGPEWGPPGYGQSALCRCQYLRTRLGARKCRSLHDLLQTNTVKKVCVSLGSTYYMVEHLEKILFLLSEALKTVFFHLSGKPVINKTWNHNYFNACRFKERLSF